MRKKSKVFNLACMTTNSIWIKSKFNLMARIIQSLKKTIQITSFLFYYYKKLFSENNFLLLLLE